MHPTLIASTTEQRGVFTRPQALACGYSEQEIRHLLRRGDWVVLRRGVMATAATLARATSPSSRHLLDGAAALVSLGCDPVLSHRTAALAWDLPLLGTPPVAVELTTASQNRRRSSGLKLHTARTPDSHRGVAAGLAVTSAARTVSDLARSESFAAAVVAADAALHAGLCDAAALERVIHDCWVWRGIVRTKRVAAFADGSSESPGESLSRVALATHGLPAPVLQGELVLEGAVVRVDFLWPELGVVGEFDGRLKYADPGDLWREKQREDLIRRAGYVVVRWVWADVYPDPTRFIARLSAVLVAAA